MSLQSPINLMLYLELTWHVLVSRLISRSSALLRQYKRTHYEVLGLSPAASQSDIRDAFVKLSKEVVHFIGSYVAYLLYLCKIS